MIGFPTKKKKNTSPSPSVAREKGLGLISTLRFINAEPWNIPEQIVTKTDPQTGKQTEISLIESMKKNIQAMIYSLEKAPTLVDDIQEVDKILQNLAETLSTAVKVGNTNQAKWCIYGLSAGIVDYRQNVPENYQNRKEEYLKAVKNYLENYVHIVNRYGDLVASQNAIKEMEVLQNDLKKKYEEDAQAIRKLTESEDGQRIIGNIKASVNAPFKLTSEEKTWALTIDRADSIACKIVSTYANIHAKERQNISTMSQITGYQMELSNKPHLVNVNASAEYSVLLDEQIESINAAFVEAEKVLQIEQRAKDKLEAITNNPTVQNLFASTSKALDKILLENKNKDDNRARLEWQILQRKLNAQRNVTPVINQSQNATDINFFNENTVRDLNSQINENTTMLINTNT